MANDNSYNDIPECPLCLEPLGLDDINFYPCACRYQICRFCWHRIRTDENGLCPHCREVYPENPAEYTPPTSEQLAKLKSEKKQKEQCKRQKVVESREKLASVRVVQKNLVFVIGLSPRLADPEVLKRNEYFGKYGKIYKVVINNHTIYNGAQGPSVSAYVTYCRNEDASKAIAAVNNAFIDGRSLKASFGTTKYCTNFLKGALCTKPDCMYLHELGEDEASFTKEDMQLGKHQVFENATLASLLPVTGGSGGGRDHIPSLPVEGGVKIKHNVVPRNKEVFQPDAAESALPVTAHWASILKGQGGTESSSSDQSHSQPKQSNSSVSHSRPAKNMTQSYSPGTEVSNNIDSKLNISARKVIKDGNVDLKHEYLEQDENTTTFKSASRPGSVSPNTQKTGNSRTSEPKKQSFRDRERSSFRTTHSRGGSITKSLSPRSTLSASSSSGSLRQETEDSVEVGVPVGVELPSAESEGSGEANMGVNMGRKIEGGDVNINVSSSENPGEAAVEQVTVKFEDKIEVKKPNIHYSKSIGNSREAMAIPVSCSGSIISPVTVLRDEGVEGSSPPISSPPGLSKTKQPMPLPLSTQSEKVCRQLDLGHSSPLALNVADESSALKQMVGSDDKKRELIGQKKLEESGYRLGLTQDQVISNNVITSLTSAGSSHFGSLGVNWSVPVVSNPHSPNLSNPHIATHPHNTHSSSLLPQTNSTSLFLHSASTRSPDQVDDGDELGFDPWDVSQQGLADLLETEAEQQQQKQQNKPHPLGGATLGGHHHLGNRKGRLNGLNDSFMGHGMYKNWDGFSSPPVTSTAPVPTTMSSGLMGVCGGFSNAGGNESLQDEFRALFPNVNISFGGAISKPTKLEKPSPLVQALDASNPSTYLPSHLATALNYSYHTPHHRPTLPQGLPHYSHVNKQNLYPSSDTTTPSLAASNIFLGQSQPGFPASCFRVKGHGGGLTTPVSTTAAVTSQVTGTTTSTFNCLGSDWLDLGVTVGQATKVQSPSVAGTTKNGGMESGGSGDSIPWKIASNSKGLDETQSIITTAVASTTSTVSALPSPPPGFSKNTPLSGHTLHDGSTAGGVTVAAVGTGSGNQTVTSANPVNPMLLVNSKGPNNLLQQWNFRNLANLTPAQQQQLRTNQLTYQQLLAQQYLFQQAMLRNPLLQAQSLRMAQLHQQALLQQQQVLMAASLAAGGVSVGNSSGSAKSNSGIIPTSSNHVQFVSMAGPTSLSNVPSVSQSGSKVTVGAGVSSNSSKSGTKVSRVQPSGGRNAGLSNSTKGFSGQSKTTSQVSSLGGHPSSVPSGLTCKTNEKHYHSTRTSSKLTSTNKAKSGGNGIQPSNNTSTMDKKPRQKSTK